MNSPKSHRPICHSFCTYVGLSRIHSIQSRSIRLWYFTGPFPVTQVKSAIGMILVTKGWFVPRTLSKRRLKQNRISGSRSMDRVQQRADSVKLLPYRVSSYVLFRSWGSVEWYESRDNPKVKKAWHPNEAAAPQIQESHSHPSAWHLSASSTMDFRNQSLHIRLEILSPLVSKAHDWYGPI